jgi:GxxExxY protein
MKYKLITDKILDCFNSVYTTLGYGFIEDVYEKSLLIEMKKAGLKVETKQPVNVMYDSQVVGEYVADILVDGQVFVEIQAGRSLGVGYDSQMINCLKATDIEVGLILHFGPKAEVIRRLFDNDKK